MKTSIIVSSIAALCLMLTFAEAPRSNCKENINVNSDDAISIVTVNMANMLPGVEVTSTRNKKVDFITPEEDFNYLKFDVTKYSTVDEPIETEDQTSTATETDFSYLKFDVNKFAENNGTDLTELPNTEFSYLKFDVNNYTDESEAASIDELPANEFPNLKFDVSKFYNSNQVNTDDITDLPANIENSIM